MLLTHDFWEHELFEFIEWLGYQLNARMKRFWGRTPHRCELPPHA